MIDDSLAFNELDLEESELALSLELELEHAPSKLSDSKEIVIKHKPLLLLNHKVKSIWNVDMTQKEIL